MWSRYLRRRSCNLFCNQESGFRVDKERLCGFTNYLLNCSTRKGLDFIINDSPEARKRNHSSYCHSVHRMSYLLSLEQLKDLSPKNITKRLSCSIFMLWQGHEHCHAKADHDLVNTYTHTHTHPYSHTLTQQAVKTPLLNKLWQYPRGNLI